MKKLILLFFVIAAMATSADMLRAAEAAKGPSVEDRLADLEAYVNNGSRQTNAPKALTSSAGPGHNAWMMTSAALVLFMTLPGLALFYGGLVRRKNVLSVMGSLKFAQLHGVTSAPNSDYAAWVSQNVYAMYQLMFAIITPGLIVGAI